MSSHWQPPYVEKWFNKVRQRSGCWDQEVLNVYCSPGLTAMRPHPDSNRVQEWVIEKKKRIKVRMRAVGRSTKCSFSFKCIHAIRQTPYLPEVLQKGRGRPGRWAGWGGGGQMMARRRRERRGRGMDGWKRGIHGWIEWGETEKKSRIWGVWIRGRCLFTRKGRERNGAITLHSWVEQYDWHNAAQQSRHVENRLLWAEDTSSSSSSSQHKFKLIVKQSHHYFGITTHYQKCQWDEQQNR